MVLYVVDLETTGIKGYPKDLVLEIAVVRIEEDLRKTLILDTLVSYPETYRNKIDSCWWAKKSGLSFDDLQNSPSMEEVWQKLTEVLRGKKLTSWNVGFDLSNFLSKMQKTYGEIGYIKQKCPMWVCAQQMIPIFGKKKPPKLEQAARYYNITPQETDYHRARFDTILASDVIIEMMKRGHYSSEMV